MSVTLKPKPVSPYKILPGERVRVKKTLRALNLTTGTYQNLKSGRVGNIAQYCSGSGKIMGKFISGNHVFVIPLQNLNGWTVLPVKETPFNTYQLIKDTRVCFNFWARGIDDAWECLIALSRQLERSLVVNTFLQDGYALRIRINGKYYQIYPFVIDTIRNI